jgi:hypothetical protein
MKAAFVVALVSAVTFASSAAIGAERECRPSLSNGYHCPGNSRAAPRSNPSPSNAGRRCIPSLSNLWTCPDTGRASTRSARSGRACRPSLSNGYHCPGVSAEHEAPKKPTRTTNAPERACRPSLSNGFKCPRGQVGANQYGSERQASAHCPTDTVVWANTRSNIYHFEGTYNYGTTAAGAYMCEQDALDEGMRAARNETHP